MKQLSWLFLAVLSLSSCTKPTDPWPVSPAKITNANAIASKSDTIPDGASFKIKLGEDSVNTDETAFIFMRLSNVGYDIDEDAIYFQGFGQVSLSSISADSVGLAINELPYTAGMLIPLNVQTKTDGDYFLKISYEKNIPDYIQVWLKDNYLKDSVNLRTGNYNFSVLKANTNTFGSRRFKVVLKDSGRP